MKIEFVYNSPFAYLVLVLGCIIIPISISSYPELFFVLMPIVLALSYGLHYCPGRCTADESKVTFIKILRARTFSYKEIKNVTAHTEIFGYSRLAGHDVYAAVIEIETEDGLYSYRSIQERLDVKELIKTPDKLAEALNNADFILLCKYIKEKIKM